MENKEKTKLSDIYTERITFMVTKEQVEKINAICSKKGIMKTNFFRDIIEKLEV